MTRILTITCDYSGCREVIGWDPDGVNESPEGWGVVHDGDEMMDHCPAHGADVEAQVEEWGDDSDDGEEHLRKMERAAAESAAGLPFGGSE